MDGFARVQPDVDIASLLDHGSSRRGANGTSDGPGAARGLPAHNIACMQ